MAFGSKHATLVRDYELILSFDPALDAEEEGFADKYLKYLETGDAGQLPLKAGQSPTVWKVQHLRGEVAEQLLDELSDVPRDKLMEGIVPRRLRYRACKLALVGWKNLLNDEGGEEDQPKRDPGPGGFKQLSEDTMEWLSTLTPQRGQIPAAIGERALQKLVLNPLS